MLKSPSPPPRPLPMEVPTENIFTVEQLIRLHGQVRLEHSFTSEHLL